MDIQVKQRLTGATILVALVVLLVPELLTGPNRTGSKASPGRTIDRAMRSYSIDLGEGRARPHAARTPVARAVTPITPVIDEAPAPASRSAEIEPSPPKRSAALASTPERVPAAEPPPVMGWSVQLGSFQSRDNAHRLLKELKGKGFSAFILEGGGTSGKLYRVRAGPAADRAAAAALAAKLREIGQPGSIVPYP
jgi:DedD protein